MKMSKIVLASLGLCLLASNVVAEEEILKPVKAPEKLVIEEDNVKVDRSYRANPYANTPSYAQGGDSSRYATDQGWSRGRGNWWWGGRGSDMPTTGYTTPSGD